MSIKDLLLKIKGECQNSIFLIKHKAKKSFGADFFTAIIIVGAAFASFGLGRLSSLEGKKPPVLIEKNLLLSSLPDETVPGVSNKSLADGKKTQNNSPKSFVASKSGKKYYLPWCGGVSNIKEGNKVWFASEAEAKKSGYTPASNCKGL